MAVRVVISEPVGDTFHSDTVRARLLATYSGLSSAEIVVSNTEVWDSLAYANSIGAIAVNHSYTGPQYSIEYANLYYPNILLVQPLGLNTYYEETALSEIPDSLIVTSAGGADLLSQNSYGNGLEFVETWFTGSSYNRENSYTNPGVLAKMLNIKDGIESATGTSIGWGSVREYARATASNGGTWGKYNGYGRIDVQSAIALGIRSQPAGGGRGQTMPKHFSPLRGRKIGSRYF